MPSNTSCRELWSFSMRVALSSSPPCSGPLLSRRSS
nr:MAG TPA: hypothetical protein [Caudoviricetes sp.]